MSGYIGNTPVPQATQTRDVFTATSGQTSFATSGYTPGYVDVWLNGVKLVDGSDFTASNGSDVVLTSGAAASDIVEVLSYSTYEVNAQTYTGGLTAKNDGAAAITANRLNSDGSIFDLKRDGTTTASIGVSAGDDVYFAGTTGSSKGIYFNANGVLPATTNGAASDNTVDLGETITRWRNLYLSGGVYLGGTGGENYLSDYEEGTWTPSFSTASSYNFRQGNYVKVGKVVTVTFQMDFFQNGPTFGGIGSLPFIVANTNYAGISTREYYSTGNTYIANLIVGGTGSGSFHNPTNNPGATSGQRYGFALGFSYITT